MGLGIARVKSHPDEIRADEIRADEIQSDEMRANENILRPRPKAVSGMAVERLVLTNFRSYARAEIRVPARMPAMPLVLSGANGAGKTNLLEALSFLMPGRGLRSARLSDVTAMAASGSGWAVAATLNGLEGVVSVGTGISGAGALAAGDTIDADEVGAERRLVRVAGESHGSTAILGRHLRMVWLTPQMDGLFLEGASGRRRFLDRLAVSFHVGHGQQLSGYERAMRERNRLLAEGGADPAWLKALEAQMAEFGTALAASRLDTILQLQAALDMAAGVFPRARIAVQGFLEEALQKAPAVEVEDMFKAELQALRKVDAAAGRATLGPHRTDFAACHAPRDMPAALCSTGEQKALLLGITLGSARMIAAQTGMSPLLLLDEVVAHLDAGRRAALFDEICALGAQVWLTGADHGLFDGLAGRAMYFTVANGAILETGC